jgi:hypothetical protein
VDEAGDEPLKELPLPQDDHGLVLDALGDLPEAIDRLAELDEVDQQPRAPGEERAADGEQRGERESSSRDVYEDRALPRRVIADRVFARAASADRVLSRPAIRIAPSGAPR